MAAAALHGHGLLAAGSWRRDDGWQHVDLLLSSSDQLRLLLLRQLHRPCCEPSGAWRLSPAAPPAWRVALAPARRSVAPPCSVSFWRAGRWPHAREQRRAGLRASRPRRWHAAPPAPGAFGAVHSCCLLFSLSSLARVPGDFVWSCLPPAPAELGRLGQGDGGGRAALRAVSLPGARLPSLLRTQGSPSKTCYPVR